MKYILFFKRLFKKIIDSSKNNNCAVAFQTYAMVNYDSSIKNWMG